MAQAEWAVIKLDKQGGVPDGNALLHMVGSEQPDTVNKNEQLFPYNSGYLNRKLQNAPATIDIVTQSMRKYRYKRDKCCMGLGEISV